ncbi:hypothetical protein EOPP23_11175 [Endozoicomonas sp. OPT23]|uniref:hypothetical protein n=1 Tax=Endozoicomonas sp. OPT23 TaxID=2072845 RepID=UPI00129A90EF|nr:hypothetical protein [Endozoicomonas sp. OPT23]MRI33547.1 hypothetical protein [Endozoicomonas sp. OPT23]
MRMIPKLLAAFIAISSLNNSCWSEEKIIPATVAQNDKTQQTDADDMTVSEDDGSEQSFEYTGPRLDKELDDFFKASSFPVVQHVVLGTAKAMTIHQNYVADPNEPNNKAKTKTVWRFTVFNPLGAVLADKFSSDKMGYTAPQVSFESQKAEGSGTTKPSDNALATAKKNEVPFEANALANLLPDDFKMEPHLFQYIPTTKSQPAFGQEHVTKSKEGCDEPGSIPGRIPLGGGEYLQAGNPLAGLGLSELAISLNSIQDNNPGSGTLVVYASFDPNYKPNSAALFVQLCQANSLSEEIERCSGKIPEMIPKGRNGLFTSQYNHLVDDLLDLRLDGKGRFAADKIDDSFACSWVGWCDTEEDFKKKAKNQDAEKPKSINLFDPFAKIANTVVKQASDEGLVASFTNQEVIQDNTYQLSLAREGALEDKLSYGNTRSLVSVTLDLQQVAGPWESTVPSVIKIHSGRKSDNYTQTIFRSPEYFYDISLTPAEFQDGICTSLGFTKVKAYADRTIDLLNKMAFMTHSHEQEVTALKDQYDQAKLVLEQEHEKELASYQKKNSELHYKKFEVEVERDMAQQKEAELKKTNKNIAAELASLLPFKAIASVKGAQCWGIEMNANGREYTATCDLIGVHDEKRASSVTYKAGQCDLKTQNLKLVDEGYFTYSYDFKIECVSK